MGVLKLIAALALFAVLRGLTPFFFGATWPDGLITIAMAAVALAVPFKLAIRGESPSKPRS